MSGVRVRFGPSPSGVMHIGALRGALFNYLFARKHGGRFVLRIEDTDRARVVPGAVDSLMSTLRWVGLNVDEGPEVGGPYGPYVQSERTALYRAAGERLLQAGQAYRCFCSAERLEQMRVAQRDGKGLHRYDRRCRDLSPEDVRARLRAGVHYVVRQRVPDARAVRVVDLVRGDVTFECAALDDQVLLKSDGLPTYHLASVVDDFEMRITHVIRGEDWLSSTPKHVLLYEALGYEMPQFAHLPLLLNPDRSKLSKRQGSMTVEACRDQGFYPEAMVNFVALLGWNPGSEREFYALEELAREFSLERVSKAAAVLDLNKLRWMNGEYLKARPLEELAGELRRRLVDQGANDHADAYLCAACRLLRDRVSLVGEMLERASWLFLEIGEYDNAGVKRRWNAESAGLLSQLAPHLRALEDFTAAELQRTVEASAAHVGRRTGEIVHPLRLACTGVDAGPGLYDLMEVLGRDRCLARIRQAIEKLG